MSPTSTSWNWECSHCVTNKSLGFPLQTTRANNPKDDGWSLPERILISPCAEEALAAPHSATWKLCIIQQQTNVSLALPGKG